MNYKKMSFDQASAAAGRIASRFVESGGTNDWKWELDVAVPEYKAREPRKGRRYWTCTVRYFTDEAGLDGPGVIIVDLADESAKWAT